jgi:hypothetical protein
METDLTNLFIRKLEYFKLTLEISRYRCKGEDPPVGLLMQAHEIGNLAQIQSEDLDSLLFDIYKQ